MSEHQDKPVAWMDKDGCLWNTTTHPDSYTPLYTRPAQWVGLTNAERLNIAVACGAMDANWIDLAREIEDALLEKNS